MKDKNNAHNHDGHPHDHAHTDAHGADQAGHTHSHGKGILGWVATIFHWHGHAEDEGLQASDPALATEEGIRTIWLALAALGATTLFQIIIVLFSGSVALFADTAHNLGDTLNSIPLLIAFYLARRAVTRRYTYGYGKAEDIAGIFIVLSIAISAGIIFWESLQKLLNPQPMQNIPWVAAAAIIGFIGNETVALLQIRTGKRIGSDAMVADGLHARTDGLTSLAVLIAVGGTLIGLPIVDPIIGILIGIAILFITKDAALRMWYRLMDAVDPKIVDEIEHAIGHVEGVQKIERVQARWVGHQLQADVVIVVDEDLGMRESHAVADTVEWTLHDHLPHLTTVTMHLHPCGHGASSTASQLGKSSKPATTANL